MYDVGCYPWECLIYIILETFFITNQQKTMVKSIQLSQNMMLNTYRVVRLGYNYHLGLDATKPVFGVSEKAKLKPVSSATETSWKIEISLVASLDMILFNKRTTKALIRLRECAGWSAPLLFAIHRKQVFSRRGHSMSVHVCPRCNLLLRDFLNENYTIASGEWTKNDILTLETS